ncbi:MAG: nucleotidyltransferase domain-containing protein, partial [Clostridiaceae bacterium]|nr:nucleotidyltransferase domain-containing protein [Clostridiaceae bacterium]
MRNLAVINNKIKKLGSYFENVPEILTVYIFGSFGTGNNTILSDIDFAILFTAKIPLIKEMEIAAEISFLLGTDNVDLVNLNKAPVHIQHKAISTGNVIYERNSLITKNFIEEVLEIHHDYSFIFEKFKQDFY